MPKKSSSKRVTRQGITDEQRRANWQNLTEAIIAVLEDDATPAFIYNDLHSFIMETCDRTRVQIPTPEVLRLALPMALTRALDAEQRRSQ